MNFRSAFGSRFSPFARGQTRRASWFSFGKKSSVPALYQPRKESWLKPTMVLVGIIPFFTFGLGTWQLKRLQWKINLIDELEEKLQLQPLSLPPKINLAVIPEFTYRRVMVRGRWDHKRTIFLRPRVRDGVHGVHVVTPLVRENGSTVLVDRGFVSSEQLDSLSKHNEGGEVEVLGMLQTTQKRNNFTPDNDPAAGMWYWTDVEEMADHAGGAAAGVQPVFIEQIFEGHAGDAGLRMDKGIPVGRAPTVDLRNSHLSYVITWYCLSGLTAFMFYRVVANRRAVKRMPRFK